MRVSDLFTPGSTDSPTDGYNSGSTARRNYYYNYYDEGYYNNTYSGFERGPTRRSFLGILG